MFSRAIRQSSRLAAVSAARAQISSVSPSPPAAIAPAIHLAITSSFRNRFSMPLAPHWSLGDGLGLPRWIHGSSPAEPDVDENLGPRSRSSLQQRHPHLCLRRKGLADRGLLHPRAEDPWCPGRGRSCRDRTCSLRRVRHNACCDSYRGHQQKHQELTVAI